MTRAVLIAVLFLTGCTSYHEKVSRANDVLGKVFSAIGETGGAPIPTPSPPEPAYPRSTIIVDGRVVNCYDLGNNTVVCP